MRSDQHMAGAGQARSVERPGKVLLVMPDSPERLSFVSRIKAAGWDVQLAGDAITVQSTARRVQPDFIIVGSGLPAGGSAEAIKRLRRNVHTTAIPIVALAPGAEAVADADLTVSSDADFAGIRGALGERLDAPAVPLTAPADVITDPDRLATLRATGLLGEDLDSGLDMLTKIAANLLDTPVALCLVDKNRQYFKSHLGLAEPWATRRETPLSHSFCQWVVSSEEPLIVEDARRHPVLKENLAIRDLGVISYAGTPVGGLSGQVLGSMCAVDSKPRRWTEDEIAVLRNLSDTIDGHSVHVSSNLTEDVKRTAGQTLLRGIRGATRLLRYEGSRLNDAARMHILTLVDRLSDRLLTLIS